MNSGKIVDAQSIDENLRYGTDYKVQPGSTFYHYREDGGFAAAVEMCTGKGAIAACQRATQSWESDFVMCPRVLDERRHPVELLAIEIGAMK